MLVSDDNAAYFIPRSATLLYTGVSDHHKGDLCAVPDTSSGLTSR